MCLKHVSMLLPAREVGPILTYRLFHDAFLHITAKESQNNETSVFGKFCD